MTHDELVEAAARWLYNTKRCSVVVTELSGGEEPDAIGWRMGFSILVECKTSLSDLRRDRQKPSRRHEELGMGRFRYLLVPEELADKVLEKQLLPEGWGLLVGELKPNGAPIAYEQVIVGWDKPVPFAGNPQREASILCSVLRRIAGEKRPVSGVSIRCYRDGLFPSKSRATVGVAVVEDVSEHPLPPEGTGYAMRTIVPVCPSCGLKANEGHLLDCENRGED